MQCNSEAMLDLVHKYNYKKNFKIEIPAFTILEIEDFFSSI